MNVFSINEYSKQAAFKPVGFSELRDIFKDARTDHLSSGQIRQILCEKYKFSEGQASGTIRRACSKNLLMSAGNAEYVYNYKYPEFDDNSDDDPDKTFIQSVKDIIFDVIETAGNKINITTVSDNDLILFKKLLNDLKAYINASDQSFEFISPNNRMPEFLSKSWADIQDEEIKSMFWDLIYDSSTKVTAKMNLFALSRDEVIWLQALYSLLNSFV